MLIVPAGLQISAWIPGFDVSQRHLYNIFAGYDTRGSPFFTGTYGYRFHTSQQLSGEFDYLPSYLIATKEFLRAWSATAGWSISLGNQLPSITLSAISRRVEATRLGPAVQSNGVNLSITYTPYTRTVPQNIAPTYLTRFMINHAQYFRALGSDTDFYAFQFGFDQYIRSPWTQRHVFKFSARLGLTQGTPLYNSFFQGGGELMVSPGRPVYLNRGFLPGTFFKPKTIDV